MADYLKNNSVALRHCLLYEYLQKNPYKRAFTNICDTIGSDVFTEEELRSYFSQFRKRKMDGYSRPITDMRDVLQNDKHALRACVLYEFLKYKMVKCDYPVSHLWPRSFLKLPGILREPSFSLFNNFCKKLGDDVMEYREFDFWFYRFVNGEFDLNYEREKDEKIYELTDMPLDVMKNVVEYLDTFDRVSLIKTSRSVKTFVEDQKAFSKELAFGLNRACEHSQIIKTSSGRDIFFLHIPYDYEEPIKGELEVFDEATQLLEAAFKPIQQLHVKKLSLATYNMNPLLNILPSLEPGYLTRIELYIPANSCRFEELEKLEQWKQTKCLKMNHPSYVAPLFHLYHFKEFHVRLLDLPVQDIREMKEILFDSPDFERCTIALPYAFDMDTIRHEFGDLIQEKTYHYPIPNSEDYFKIEIRDSNIYGIISITRKQK